MNLEGDEGTFVMKGGSTTISKGGRGYFPHQVQSKKLYYSEKSESTTIDLLKGEVTYSSQFYFSYYRLIYLSLTFLNIVKLPLFLGTR